jgi:hypothetical protein
MNAGKERLIQGQKSREIGALLVKQVLNPKGLSSHRHKAGIMREINQLLKGRTSRVSSGNRHGSSRNLSAISFCFLSWSGS